MLLRGFPNYAETVVHITLQRNNLLQLDAGIAQLWCYHKGRGEDHLCRQLSPPFG